MACNAGPRTGSVGEASFAARKQETEFVLGEDPWRSRPNLHPKGVRVQAWHAHIECRQVLVEVTNDLISSGLLHPAHILVCAGKLQRQILRDRPLMRMGDEETIELSQNRGLNIEAKAKATSKFDVVGELRACELLNPVMLHLQ